MRKFVKRLAVRIQELILRLKMRREYFGIWPRPGFKKSGQKLYRSLVDNFIPNSGNNHHPRILKHRTLFGYSVLLILLKVAAIVLPVALPSSSLFSSAITPINIVELTNQTRGNLGLGELKANSLLAAAATAKANDIINNQYFAHTSPAGLNPWYWIDKAGYNYLYAGENLAIHYESAEDVTEGWLASPTHRANIVQPKYNDIGVGVAYGIFDGVESTVVVQMFGVPEVTPVPVAKSTSPAATNLAKAPVKPAADKISNEGKVAAAETKSAPQPKPVAVNTNPAPLAVVPPPVSSVEQAVAFTPEEARQSVLEPATAESARQPLIYDSSVKITLQPGAYLVRLAVSGATAVIVQLANQWVPLQPVSAGSLWEGVVPFNSATFNKAGEPLSAVAWSSTGSIVSKSLALVAPLVQTQQLYNFNDGTDKYTKFLGVITVHNLQDKVRQFYFFFIVFLVAALLLNVLIKIHIQHFSVISHTMLVIGLALVLFVV